MDLLKPAKTDVGKCMKKTIVYLCLEGTQEGQASYTHVHEIINGLRNRGWEVILYQPEYSSESKPGPFKRLVKQLIIQLKLWKMKQVDVLYIRAHFAAWPTALWAWLRQIPVVQEVNGPYQDLFLAWPVTRFFSWIFKLLLRTQWHWANAIIAVTPQLAAWVQQESRNSQVYVIPNGVNTTIFNPNASSKLPLPEKYIVFFGALAPWQGIETMLRAVQQPEWPSGVKLVIVGDGTMRTQVERAANDKIIYLGKVPYKEMPGIIARSIGGLSPQNCLGGRSQTGLFPLKVFETLACGVPVIVTDFPGQADLVKEGQCGLIIPPEDPAALARAVACLYLNPLKRFKMGKRGREFVEMNHSWDLRAAETDRVLRNILGL
ncbi:MAG: glycosyltransferase family 4 protein [Candidatus Bathyarchaeia archaeon]